MQNIIKIIRLARPLYHLVAWLTILIITTVGLRMVSPILSKFIVDNIVGQIKGGTGDIKTLTLLIGLSFFFTFLSIVISALSERIGDHFAGRLRRFLTLTYYDKVLRLPQSYFDGELSGKIINQLNRGIATIYGFINTATNFILPSFLQAIFTIAILAYYNVPIALFLTALFPIYFWISFKSSKKWGEKEGLKNQIEDSIRGRLQEAISNIKLVKGFTTEMKEFGFVDKNLKKSNDIYAEQSTTFHIYDFFRNLSLQIILLIISVIGFYEAFNGRLSIGELVLILQLVGQAQQPLFAMSFILARVQEAEAGSKEFFKVLDLESAEDYSKEPSRKIFNKAHISFKNVSFAYEKENSVLKKISFEMKPNEKVALVGHSGAGKSTLINLIMKFYEPTAGDILINGQSYKAVDHATIRKNISLVFQESELFSTTIRENVAYGSTASEAEIIEALKKANAWDFVKKLPKGLDAQIGERGVRLSGGQKQRVQIARAVLRNAPILILDEATSSLDAKSEKEVQEALEFLMEDKLVIIIAHRFSTIQNVDTILVINEGKIEDYGNPQELAQKKGIYSDLLQYQIQGNEKLLKRFELS